MFLSPLITKELSDVIISEADLSIPEHFKIVEILNSLYIDKNCQAYEVSRDGEYTKSVICEVLMAPNVDGNFNNQLSSYFMLDLPKDMLESNINFSFYQLLQGSVKDYFTKMVDSAINKTSSRIITNISHYHCKIKLTSHDYLRPYDGKISPLKNTYLGLKSGTIKIHYDDPASELSSADSYAIYAYRDDGYNSGYVSASNNYIFANKLSGARLFQTEAAVKSYINKSFGPHSVWRPIIVKIKVNMEDLVATDISDTNGSDINSALSMAQKQRLEAALSEATMENLLTRLKNISPEISDIVDDALNKNNILDSQPAPTQKTKRMM